MSSNDRSKTLTNGVRKSFGPGGCQASTDAHRKCGETKTLQIIEEFRNLYENKMKQIDAEAGGDCVQAKINLQQDWIRDLTEQNEMLVRAVEELEVEAADRVNMLEEKLKSSSKCACEVMESYRDFSINLLEDLQKMERGQNDLNNLIELIRRARNDGEWNTDGLNFYSIDVTELLGLHTMANIAYEQKEVSTIGLRKDGVVDDKVPKAIRVSFEIVENMDPKVQQLQKALKEKDKKLKELEEKLKGEDGLEYKKQLQDLKKSMLDMRDALTAEVAHKHDTIVSLRHDVHLLEEQCRKADQQTHFKDDIIKELRKEIKQMKHQRPSNSKSRSPRTVKKEHSRSSPVHCSQTDPNTALHNLKDGVIVIKDTATIGDSVATQNIKEKYSDPANQTIIYICESDKRKKEKIKRNSPKDGASPPQVRYPATSKDVENSRCRNHLVHSPDANRNVEKIPARFGPTNFKSELFFDQSYGSNFENALLAQSRESAPLSKSYEESRSHENRNHEVSRSFESYHMDCPRGCSGHMDEIESSFCFKKCDSMSTCQDIRATCAQYSKDIINMLSRNVSEHPEKGKSEFCMAETSGEFPTCLVDLPVHCSEKSLIEAKEESMVLSGCSACEKLIRDNEDVMENVPHEDKHCGDFGSKIDVVREKIGNQCLDLAQKETCGSKSNCAKNFHKYHHMGEKRCCDAKQNDVIVNHCCVAHIKDNFKDLNEKCENHCCVMKENIKQELCMGETYVSTMPHNCSSNACGNFRHETSHNDSDKKSCGCNVSNIMCPNVDEGFLKKCDCVSTFKQLDTHPNNIVDLHKNLIDMNEKNDGNVCTINECVKSKMPQCEFLINVITNKPAIKQIDNSEEVYPNPKHSTTDENCVNEQNVCVGDCVWSKMKAQYIKLNDGRTSKQDDSCIVPPIPCSDVDLKWCKLMETFCGDNDLRNVKFFCPVIDKDFSGFIGESDDVKPSLIQPEVLKLMDQIKDFVPNVQSQYEKHDCDMVEKIYNSNELPKDLTAEAVSADAEWPQLRQHELSKEENLSVDSLDVQSPSSTKFLTGNLINADFCDLGKIENMIVSAASKDVTEGKFTPQYLNADRDVLISKFENRQIQTDKNFYETKSSQTCNKEVRKEMVPSTSTNRDCAYSKIVDRHPQLNAQETTIERELSFNEGEISGFSTPCGVKTQNNFRNAEHPKITCKTRYVHNLSRSVPKCNTHEDRAYSPTRKGHMHRNCDICLPPGGAHSSTRSSWRSHRVRHPVSHEPKALSHRTLLRGAKKQNDAPISSRSQSYPLCSKNPTHDYVPGCHYVDMHFLMNNQNVRNYFGTDGKKYINVLELSEADKKVLMQTSESLKHKQLMYEYSRMNNTY